MWTVIPILHLKVANLPTPHLDSGFDLLPPAPFNPPHTAFLWDLYL